MLCCFRNVCKYVEKIFVPNAKGRFLQFAATSNREQELDEANRMQEALVDIYNTARKLVFSDTVCAGVTVLVYPELLYLYTTVLARIY
jgi:hypothetical protein